MDFDRHKREAVLDAVYRWSSERQFKGYNKHDGLNSPVLRVVLGWHRWLRLVAIQLVMRSPVNIRPLLFVPPTVNPKGLALFILGLLDRYEIEKKTYHLHEAERLGQKLLKLDRRNGGWSGSCWGYPYPWQDLGFYATPHTPNAVVSCFVCEALLALYRKTGSEQYLDAVHSSTKFMLSDLRVLEDTPSTLCLSYMPVDMSMRVMDVSILISSVFAQYARESGDDTLLPVASRLAGFVVDRQTDYHAWYYTDPPDASFIRHDNYHTGFILDALWRYMEAAGNWEWLEQYEKGLEFYATKLFNKNGAPRWMSDREFPYDIHGSAQGLVSFSLAVKNGFSYRGMLNRIGKWALDNMYRQEGRFIYRRGKHVNYNFTLLRWCNAWMFRGVATWNKQTIQPEGEWKKD